MIPEFEEAELLRMSADPGSGVEVRRLGIRRLMPLLSSPLELNTLRRLRPFAVVQQFQKGQMIFYEDHWPLGVHIHASGPIRFLRREKKVVPECRAPCLIGLRILLAGAQYPCSAVALGHVWAGFISRSSIKAILDKHPALLSNPSDGVAKKPNSVPGDAFIS